MDLESSDGARCDLRVPSEVQVMIQGDNGKVNLDRLQNSIHVDLTNGQIQFLEDPSANYRHENSVLNGRVSPFKSSKSKSAYDVRLSLVNGNIEGV